MKKFFSMMVAFAALFAFASCENNPTDEPGTQGGTLETPVLRSENVGETSFTVAWDVVKGATGYMVNLQGKNYSTEETSYTFENLNAGNYTVRVKAVGSGDVKDSQFASITVTLTGASSIDWFTQTLAPAEYDAEKGYGPYNALTFVWKGKGVKEICYGIYSTASIEGVSDKEIINAISANSFNDAEALAEINSENGLSATYYPLSGGTEYTAFAYVTNEAGVEFLVKTVCATEVAETAEEAKQWLGTWNVKSHKAYSIDDKGQGTVIDKEDAFTVTVTASPSSPYQLYIDGFSVLGEGWPATAEVDGDRLFILNGSYMGSSEDGSSDYVWLGWYNFPEAYGGLQISANAYPSFVLYTDEAGKVICTNKFSMYDDKQNEVPVECYCSDVCGVTQEGYIQFFIEEFPAVFRSGDMEWTKAEPAAAALHLNTVKKQLPVMPTSLVVAE